MKLEQLHKLWWAANGWINIYRKYCNITCLYISSGDTSINFEYILYMKSSFPKRYKSILIVFMKIYFFYLDPYILLIFNLSC